MWSAHPRVCGENEAENTTVQVPPGSSPRVRGKLVSEMRHYRRQRLIPACAGKT